MRSIVKALLLFAALCGGYSLQAQELRLKATPPSVGSFISSYGISLTQVLDTLHTYLDPADTAEGGAQDEWKTFNKLWGTRVSVNDSSGADMFREYYNALRSAVLAGLDTPCGTTGGFHGAWECIGPQGMHSQTEGKIDVVWADTANPAHVLAGCQGGLFQTTDTGHTWACITDNAPFAGGLMGVTGICVNPKNENTIYLSTGIPLGGGVGSGGAAILKSFDGGITWQQEIIPVAGNYFDSIENIQGIYMTPDSMRLYVLMGRDVYTRYNVDTGNTWQKITPWGKIATWRNLQFVPGDRTRFFISTRTGIYDTVGSIWESADSVGSSWTCITSGFVANIGGVSYADTGFDHISISMPDSDTLFLAIQAPTQLTCLYKYSLSTNAFYMVNPSFAGTYGTAYAAGKGELLVSAAATTNNGGLRNIYYGNDVPYHSWDGGITFTAIGTYFEDPTHGDVRSFFLQQATNTLRGDSDRLLIATDGGVSLKQAGLMIMWPRVMQAWILVARAWPPAPSGVFHRARAGLRYRGNDA